MKHKKSRTTNRGGRVINPDSYSYRTLEGMITNNIREHQRRMDIYNKLIEDMDESLLIIYNDDTNNNSIIKTEFRKIQEYFIQAIDIANSMQYSNHYNTMIDILKEYAKDITKIRRYLNK